MYPFESWLQAAGPHRQESGRPLVSLCYAQSLDGSLTARRGQPTALSGRDAQLLTHRLRSLHSAILVGVGTLLADDPLLNVRLVQGAQPRPLVLDSRLRTPPEARLFQSGRAGLPPWIATTVPASVSDRAAGLQAVGARLLGLPEDAAGQVSLSDLLDCLGNLGVDSLMVEGGAQVISSFLQQRLADFIVVTIAPLFLGGLPAVSPGLFPLPESGGAIQPSNWPSYPRLVEVGSQQLGDDLIIWGRF
jgi:3,4-dihydroxy 2-butanone 4-phosphate synthase/GTP cyclohydrolase II